MRQVSAFCVLLGSLALVGCEGLSNLPRSTAPAPQSTASNPSSTTSQQPLTRKPDVLLWNWNSDGNRALLYAYWIDSNGQLTLLPGLTLQSTQSLSYSETQVQAVN